MPVEYPTLAMVSINYCVEYFWGFIYSPADYLRISSDLSMSSEGRALLDRADKAVKSAGSGFSFFGGREEKWENAAQLYIDAANAFRAENNGVQAGKSFERAAAIQRGNLNEPGDAANSLVDAFKCYREDDLENSARVLEEALRYYTGQGNFRRAATLVENLGELYELGLGNRVKAIESYEKATQWYKTDNADSLGSRTSLKAADLIAFEAKTQEDYLKAIGLYKNIADVAARKSQGHLHNKPYYFKAGILYLIITSKSDRQPFLRAMDAYCQQDPSFSYTRECKLLWDVLALIDDGIIPEEPRDKMQELKNLPRIGQFQGLLRVYDQLGPLDKWHIAMFLRVMDTIVAQDNVVEEDFS